MLLAWLSPCFQSLPPLPTSILGPSCSDSWVGGFVYVLEPHGSLQWTLLWVWEFLPPLQPPQIFIVRGFEAFFFCTETLGCVVCLTPQLFLSVYLHTNGGPPATTLLCILSAWLPISAPPTSVNECFFNSLVVGLPYSSIFWQFWLVFVFKFVVVLLLVVQGGKIYLPMPPSSLEVA